MNSRRALAAIAAVTAAATCWALAPASAVDPADHNYVQVNVETQNVNGTVNTDPQNVVSTLVNVDTGQTLTLSPQLQGVQSVTKVPNGTYRLRVAKVGYATRWWPGVNSEAAASTFVLSKTAAACQPATGCSALAFVTSLQELRTLTGFVRQRSAAPVAGATVTAVDINQIATRFSTTSGATGQFNLSLPPGTYDLSVPNGNRTASATVTAQSAVTTQDIILLDTPSSPTGVTASSSSRSAAITWSAPSDDGGTPVTGYSATASPGGQSCAATTSRTCTIQGLTTNQPYTVTVTATNAVGTSAPSTASNTITPGDPLPGAPRSVRARAGGRMATVSWAPPETGTDGITGYKVTTTPGGLSCSTSDLSCDVTGLTNGTTYSFRVAAISSAGIGPQSAASKNVTPAQVPTAPRNVRVRPGNTSVLVSWQGPADRGGTAVTGYTVTSFPSGRTCTTDGTVRSCAIGGLQNGTAYSVVVTATNRMGTSERSAGSATAVPSASLKTWASTVTVRPSSRSVSGRVTVRWSASKPARQVVLRWQNGRSGAISSKAVSVSGSQRLTVGNKRLRVRVTAVDRQGRPVGEITRVYGPAA